MSQMPPLKQITEHVWIHPPDSRITRAVVGVVISEAKTVLIDAGHSINHARHIMAELERINAPPLHSVIYTHYHWDHVFGAAVYGAPVMAHQQCHFRLSEYMQKNPMSESYVAEVIARDPEGEKIFQLIQQVMAGQWEDFKIALPTLTFGKPSIQVDLGGVMLTLEHIGGNHADDSTVVTVVEDHVMFLGDSFYPPPAARRTADSTFDFEMLSRFLARGLDTYVDGHNGAISREALRLWMESKTQS